MYGSTRRAERGKYPDTLFEACVLALADKYGVIMCMSFLSYSPWLLLHDCIGVLIYFHRF